MPIDPFILEQLRQNDRSLTVLNLSNQKPKLTAVDMNLLVEALLTNSYLKSLDVSNNSIGDEGAKVLAQNTTLTELNAFSNFIHAEGAQALAQNKKLIELVLSWNPIGDDGAKAFALNETLASLYVSYTSITDEGAKALAKNRTLYSLGLSDNSIGPKGASALSDNETLTYLNLESNPIRDEGAAAFLRNHTLTSLKIGDANHMILCSITEGDIFGDLEEQIAVNRNQQVIKQGIKQDRNDIVVTMLVLLRQGPSSDPQMAREIWRHICQHLNFPSLKVRKRSGEELAKFIAEHLEEFNDRLQHKDNVRLIETINSTSAQARFSFFAPRAEKQTSDTTKQLLHTNEELRPKGV